MPIHTLSAQAVEKKAKQGLYSDGGGLYLKVTPTGTKSWVYRYSVVAPDKGEAHRRRHALGLGAYPDISLADARERARAQRLLRLDGDDPITVKRAKATERRVAAAAEKARKVTFEECANTYIQTHEAAWRDRRGAPQWRRSLDTHAHPIIGSLPVAAIDTALVMSVLQPIWTTKSETASRVRRRIENILDWATVSELRQGANPARWKGHLDKLLPKKSKLAAVKHYDKLDYRHMGTFMAELRRIDRLGARALDFAILTAARLGEVVKAKWSEIDFNARLWTVPAEHMKRGKEHRVPLSDAALAILQALPGNHDPDSRVFPLSGTIVWYVAKAVREDVTIHGFRGTFRDWAGDQTRFQQEVIEQCLAHRIGDATEQSYYTSDALDKRRKVMDAWARYCAMPAATTAGSDVVRLRG